MNQIVLDQVYLEMLNKEIENRRIHLNDEFNDISCFKIMYYLDKIVKMDKIKGDKSPITIVVNSYGGQLYECMALCGKIESLKEQGYQIDIEVTGKAMSCGALLLTFGTNRKVSRYATIMIHEVSSWASGNYTNLRVEMAENERLQCMIENIILKNTNIERYELRENTKGVDWYLNAEECLKYGLATEII